jgi:hypothetical protein
MLFVCFIVLVIVIMIVDGLQSQMTKRIITSDCPPHQWDWDSGKLECKKCLKDFDAVLKGD